MLHKKRFYSLICAVLAMSCFVTAAKTDSKADTSGQGVTSKVSAMETGSNRFTRPEKDDAGQVVNRLTTDGFEKVLESGRLEVWFRKEIRGIRIVDKQSGYIWGGLTEDRPENMNSTWSAIGNSLLTIEYYDKTGISKMIGIGHSSVQADYKISGGKLHYDVQFKEQGISLSFEMSVDDESICFEMNDGSIKEEKDFRLASVYFMPFLGATAGDEIDGYMFVPDGSGALMRYSKPYESAKAFDKRVYGIDYAIDNLFSVNDLMSNRPNDFAVDEQQILMPVFGLVHGVKQNAFMGVIEQGAEYASITARPAGESTDYNWVSAYFIYRQKYQQPTSKSGAGVQVVQNKKNKVTPKIRYYFLSGEDADYVGMAKQYREIIDLSPIKKADEHIDLRLDFIMADTQKGFLWDSTKQFTTTKDIAQLYDYLKKNGVLSQSVAVSGYQPGGLNGYKKAKNTVKNKGEYTALEKDNIPLSFMFSPFSATVKQLSLGSETGITLSQSAVKLTRDNEKIWLGDRYFVKSPIAARFITKQTGNLKKDGFSNVVFEDMNLLYAENLSGKSVNRANVRSQLVKAAKSAKKMSDRVGMETPNAYLWQYTDDFLNTPMFGSQLLSQTDSVPFLQIVLSGSRRMYTPYVNKSNYSTFDVLRSIEYGVYPAFLLTGTSNHELSKTASAELYSTKIADWRQEIAQVYGRMDSVLSEVQGMRIENRQVLREGVVKVTYEGGKVVVVNYTAENFETGGVTVPAGEAVCCAETF